MKRVKLIDIARVPSNYVVVLLNFMETLGVNVSMLLSKTKISPSTLQKSDDYISANQFNILLDNIDDQAQMPGLWLFYGKHLTLSAHGVLGQTIMNCPDISDVISVLFRYYKIQVPFLNLSLESTDSHAILSLERSNDVAGNVRRGPEILFASLATNLKLLLNQNEIPLRYDFTYSATEYDDVYVKLLGEGIAFDQPKCSIFLPNEVLHIPSVFSNPVMKKMYQRQCEQLLKSLQITDDPVLQVRKHLLSTPGQFPSFDEIANSLQVSVRTLRRRLNEQGVSFQLILDDVRSELALQYLRTTELSVEEIATLTGFSDTSNFRRAFTRWTGRTPSSFRRDT